MPEYVKDRHGDVWYRAGDGLWRCGGVHARTLDVVERWYGPTKPCTADGDPLPNVSDDVRALVAGAFLDLAERAGGWLFDESDDVAYAIGWRVRDWAQETAAAVLRGDVKPAELP